MEFFQESSFFRKAKHASNRAGKMQQSAAAASSIRFFGMPQFFLMFFFAFTSLLYFSSLACSRLWISFSYNEMVFRKNTKTEISNF